jgi:hypothetical protein
VAINTKTQMLTAVMSAICVALLGWVGVRHSSYIEAVPGLEILLGIIAMPGVFVEVLLEVAFSPQGGHDGQTFAWVVTPSNLVIYFAFARLLIKRVKGGSDPDNLKEPRDGNV